MSDCEICMGDGRVMVGMTYPPGKTIAVKYEYDPCPNCTPPPHTFHAKRTMQILVETRGRKATPPALVAYLRRLLDGPQRVGIAPEAVIREAERAGLVRYVRPHSRALTDAGRKVVTE